MSFASRCHWTDRNLPVLIADVIERHWGTLHQKRQI